MAIWRDEAERVSISLDGGVADVRLTRGDKMNALDPAMFAAIAAALAHLRGVAGMRCVLLSGEGRAFCAGLDMASMAQANAAGGADIADRTHGQANLFQHICWGWRELPVPVIAAIHGVAFGGGMQLASGADIRIAQRDTRLSIMEAKWGLVPDMAGMALWRGLVRDDLLRDLVYSAREVDAAEAHAIGLVTRLGDDPLAEGLALAHAIAARSPDATRAAKRLINAMPEEPSSALLAAESVEQKALLGSSNQMEAVRANFEKRAPVFIDPDPLG